jgi:hypothetical protein
MKDPFGMELDPHPTNRNEIIRHFNPVGRIWLRLVARLHEYANDIVPTTLNLSWISESLAVGGAYRRSDVRRLAALGITAVIDARAEATDDERLLAQHGITLMRLPAPDRYALSYDQLLAGAEWACDRVSAGEKVFVHCEHGVGRGPLLGAAVLVASGMSASEALRLLRARRWQAAPNDRQLEALLEFESRRRERSEVVSTATGDEASM